MLEKFLFPLLSVLSIPDQTKDTNSYIKIPDYKNHQTYASKRDSINALVTKLLSLERDPKEQMKLYVCGAIAHYLEGENIPDSTINKILSNYDERVKQIIKFDDIKDETTYQVKPMLDSLLVDNEQNTSVFFYYFNDNINIEKRTVNCFMRFVYLPINISKMKVMYNILKIPIPID